MPALPGAGGRKGQGRFLHEAQAVAVAIGIQAQQPVAAASAAPLQAQLLRECVETVLALHVHQVGGHEVGVLLQTVFKHIAGGDGAQAQPAAEVVRHISRQRMPARGIAARPARAHGGARRGHSAPGAGAIVIAAGAGAQVDFSARRGCQAQCEAAVVLLAAVFAAARVQVANEAVLPHEFARNAQIRAARLQGAAGIGAQHGAPAAAALS